MLGFAPKMLQPVQLSTVVKHNPKFTGNQAPHVSKRQIQVKHCSAVKTEPVVLENSYLLELTS